MAIRDAGGNPFLRATKTTLVVDHFEKTEETVEHSKERISAGVGHRAK